MAGSRTFLFAWILSVSVLPVSLQAQGKARFVDALERFSNAVAGPRGNEGPAIAAALDAMQGGLAEWDALIANVESRFAAEVRSATPPAAAKMRTALGTVYLERGRTDDALAQFDEAISADPQFVEVEALRALALERLERPSEAAAAYRALWEKGGNPLHGYLFLRLGPKESAAPAAAKVVAALQDGVDQRNRSRGGPLFASLALVDDASLQAPVFPPAIYAAGFAELRAMRLDATVAALRAAAASDPLVADPRLREPEVRDALERLAGGDAAALAWLADAATRLGSSEIHRVAGLAYWNRKAYEQSLEHLRNAVRLNPEDERSRLAIADVLVEHGDPAGARAVLVEAAGELPQSGLARWKLGRLSALMGDESGALAAFDAAAGIPVVAGAAHVHAAIGRLHHNSLDLDAAAAAYARRVELVPNDPAAHLDLGDVYRERGDLDAALAEFLVAALLDPASARAMASTGQMHAAAGRDADAAAALARAVEIDPSHLEARYALSRALLRLGRADDARRELATFETLQRQAMDEERRRFKENQRKIDEALKSGEPAGSGR